MFISVNVTVEQANGDAKYRTGPEFEQFAANIGQEFKSIVKIQSLHPGVCTRIFFKNMFSNENQWAPDETKICIKLVFLMWR